MEGAIVGDIAGNKAGRSATSRLPQLARRQRADPGIQHCNELGKRFLWVTLVAVAHVIK
jgi:hypothetical protein